MSWDFDHREMSEAVKEGDVDFLWAGYLQVCVERDQARSVATVARDLVETIRDGRIPKIAIAAKLKHLGQVVDGIKPIDWEAVAHLNAESWSKLQSKYHLALEVLHDTRLELEDESNALEFIRKHDEHSDQLLILRDEAERLRGERCPLQGDCSMEAAALTEEGETAAYCVECGAVHKPGANTLCPSSNSEEERAPRGDHWLEEAVADDELLAQKLVELRSAYEAIVALVEGFTQLTKPGFDAWPVRLSTTMILKPYMHAINKALVYKGRKTS